MLSLSAAGRPRSKSVLTLLGQQLALAPAGLRNLLLAGRFGRRKAKARPVQAVARLLGSPSAGMVARSASIGRRLAKAPPAQLVAALQNPLLAQAVAHSLIGRQQAGTAPTAAPDRLLERALVRSASIGRQPAKALLAQVVAAPPDPLLA